MIMVIEIVVLTIIYLIIDGTVGATRLVNALFFCILFFTSLILSLIWKIVQYRRKKRIDISIDLFDLEE